MVYNMAVKLEYEKDVKLVGWKVFERAD